MDFRLKSSDGSSGRQGILRIERTGKEYKTPLLLQATKAGSVPYLSKEAFGYVADIDNQIMQLTLSTMYQMGDALVAFKQGAAAFVGFPETPSVLVIRDTCQQTPEGGNDKGFIPVFTRNGKESLSAQRYMELVEAFAPDMYQGLSDADTNNYSSKKRVNKSVERTAGFMDYCYEQHNDSPKLKQNSALFAPIVGGYNTFARTKSAKHALNNGADICSGYILEGFHNNGLSATALKSEDLIGVVSNTICHLDERKSRYMPGAYTPVVVLELVAAGVDMFDSSYAYCATCNFKALTFDFRLTDKHSSAVTTNVFLDLTDEAYKEDFQPFLVDCSCLACHKHTRAYVHHLYKTNELLGPMLLMIHNLHHYMQFFGVVRNSMAEGSMPQLIELIKRQHVKSELVDYQILAHSKVRKETFIQKSEASES